MAALLTQPRDIPGSGLSISNDAHCKRVARLACEIGQRLGLDSGSSRILSDAAIQHHSMELFWPQISSTQQEPRICESRASFEALLVFYGVEKPKPGNQSALLAEILHLTNSFDEEFEWRIFESGPGSKIIQDIYMLTHAGSWSERVHEAFQALFAGNRDRALAKAEHLPLSTVSKVQRLALLSVEELSLDGLERLALADPVLAADLLRHANSAKYSTSARFNSVRTALAYIGTIASREVMLAFAARGIFASSSLNHLWKHSVRCASTMSFLALQAGLDRNRAFLLGLLHDVGRISFECLDSLTRSSYTQLCKAGAPAIWTEIATAGCDHAELGGDILEGWDFPETITECVRTHHSPELSSDKLTSLLYLVESTEDDNEDLTSARRIANALSRVQLSQNQLTGALTSEAAAFAC